MSGLKDEKNGERGTNLDEVLVKYAIPIHLLCLRTPNMKTSQHVLYSAIHP